MKPDVCIGITTWNSSRLLAACLRSVRETTSGLRVQLEVVDNLSSDASASIAEQFGARVRSVHCSQTVALNMLLRASRAPVTLLMHADVVLLADAWFKVCVEHLAGDVALISPEDIGCGPWTRPYGRGKPESCFMLFETSRARRCMEWKWRKKLRMPWPQRELHFESGHVTHDLPETLSARGYTWHPMRVHASPELAGAPYAPPFIPEYWEERLGRLRYAMGNFYSLDGVITHYHNWYDRVAKDVPTDSKETTLGGGRGLPVAFLAAGTDRFLSDLGAGCLQIPDILRPTPEPRVTLRHEPDLNKPWPASGTPAGS